MMKIVYTKHAALKFTQEKYVKQLKITKKIVKKVIQKPFIEDRSRGEKITAIGHIGKKYSLLVVYKFEDNYVKIITFYPAERNRYETKILQRG